MPALWAFFIYNPGIMVKKNRSKSRVIDAENAVGFYNQAVIFHQHNQLPEAESAYRTALKLNPEFAEAHNNLGNVLKDQGRLKEALSEYRKANKIYADHPILLNNIGNTLLGLGDIKQAVQYLNKAIELADDYVDPLNNLANAYRSLGKFEEAARTYLKAIEIDPNIADIHYNLASLLAYLGKTEQSVVYYKNTLQCDPDNVAAASALHHQLRNLCDWSELDALQKNIEKNLAIAESRNANDLGSPFLAVTRTDDLAQSLMIARVSSRKIISSLGHPPEKFSFAKRKIQKKRLKIGYLSDDFCDHAVMHLLSGVLREHDKQSVEIACYSYGGFDESIYRQQAIQYCDQFIDIANISDYEAAIKIFTDKIDILVDLKGHTKDNRLGVCAYRPAPVQATFLGYPGTTGADFFDYQITDKIVTPLEHQAYYSEMFAWLPDTYLPCDNRQAISNEQITRQDAGLPNDGFVFCSFNQPYKLDPVFFDIWGRLLQQVKASVIWLPKSNQTVVTNLKREMSARGVDPCRLVFAEKTATKAQHLARMQLADLALDTRIYNGHTTTIDALWAGVPVVAMQGRHFASRVSSSLLQAIGLPELVTADLAGYESLALRLASNRNELETIGEKLRLNRSSAPLFDTERFTRNLETAYEMMWQRYIAGKKPEHLEVSNPD
jgi:protein O-GlcNAc transferase